MLLRGAGHHIDTNGNDSVIRGMRDVSTESMLLSGVRCGTCSSQMPMQCAMHTDSTIAAADREENRTTHSDEGGRHGHAYRVD